jgi:hypothetical protein
MNALETWLAVATCGLSTESAAQVRAEIGEHYASAREAALNEGTTGDDADRRALDALGDARTAAYEYRQVLLTKAEAKLLRQGNWEARAVCARPWLKGLAISLPLAVLAAGVASHSPYAIAGGVAVGFLLAAPFLPIYTPARALVFRWARWTVVVATIVLLLGPNALKWSWLLFACLWPMAWVEWQRMSIRRKLPVADWPRQLYL